MCDIRFLVAQSHGSHEPLHFDRLTSEAFADEGSLGDHALPRLFFALSGTHNLEHLVFCDTSNFGQRYGILGGLVLSLLLDGSGQCLGVLLTLSVKQKGGECAVWDVGGVFLFDITLVVGFKGLFELHLLRMSFRVKKFSLKTKSFLRNSGLSMN